MSNQVINNNNTNKDKQIINSFNRNKYINNNDINVYNSSSNNNNEKRMTTLFDNLYSEEIYNQTATSKQSMQSPLLASSVSSVNLNNFNHATTQSPANQKTKKLQVKKYLSNSITNIFANFKKNLNKQKYENGNNLAEEFASSNNNHDNSVSNHENETQQKLFKYKNNSKHHRHHKLNAQISDSNALSTSFDTYTISKEETEFHSLPVQSNSNNNSMFIKNPKLNGQINGSKSSVKSAILKKFSFKKSFDVDKIERYENVANIALKQVS